MNAWPAAALVLAEGMREGPAPPAERSTEGDPAAARQADSATAPRVVTSIEFHLPTDTAAAAFIGWARAHAHRPMAFAGETRRIEEGLAGITLDAEVGPDGRRAWRGAARLEAPP